MGNLTIHKNCASQIIPTVRYRHLYDLVKSQVRGLRALGVPPESYGSLLSSVLINKLPQDLCPIASHQVK